MYWRSTDSPVVSDQLISDRSQGQHRHTPYNCRATVHKLPCLLDITILDILFGIWISRCWETFYKYYVLTLPELEDFMTVLQQMTRLRWQSTELSSTFAKVHQRLLRSDEVMTVPCSGQSFVVFIVGDAALHPQLFNHRRDVCGVTDCNLCISWHFPPHWQCGCCSEDL